MRTIKFRGFNAKNNQWLYGSHIINRGKNFVAPDEFADDKTWEDYEVEPETVGEFTGLTDKNGKEIYEGDVLREPPKNEYEKENYVAYEVFWHDNDCASHHIGWQMNRCHFQGCICGTMYIPEFLPKTASRMEIIGNVFDNPDLIEEGGDDERD